MHKSWIALGGNLGNVLKTFCDVRHDLNQDENIHGLQSSLLYQTPPIGPEGQDDYLNAALHIETSYAPLDLLDVLQSLEQQHGRVRHEHWGARTLDLDIIAYSQSSRKLPLSASSLKSCIGNLLKKCPRQDFGHDDASILNPLYHDISMDSKRLILPHQHMHWRQFVLRPMCDISPNWIHPTYQKTAQQLLDAILATDELALGEGQKW